jgi:hypothetical protein
VPGLAAAQADPVTTKSAVRIVVRSPDKPGSAGAASGFLWLQPNQVVTSLHAITGSDIKVMCGATISEASVTKVHEESDLALLTTAVPLTGCTQYNAAVEQKPPFRSVLYTYGFHAGARGGTSRDMTKGLLDPETLEYMLTPVVLQRMAKFNIPSIKLPIYYVQGGLLPGYSGAPVVNERGQLVGIVDGGLNKGQDSYNWVIPAENLKKLMASTQTKVPDRVAQAAFDTAGELYAAGIADADERTVLKDFVQQGSTYQFVKTKTMALEQLAGTADDPRGLEGLMMTYGPTIGASRSLRFDVYEDLKDGLIIAVPIGQSLAFETPMPNYTYLKTSALDAQGKDANWNGYVQFEVMTSDRILSADPRGNVSPDQLAKEGVARLLKDCRSWYQPAPVSCEVDAPSVRAFNFGNGKLLLKVGIKTRNKPPTMDTYDYYSYAINGDKAFRAYSRIHWVRGGERDGLIECSERRNEGPCSDVEGARTQFANLVAAHLTTFANLGQRAAR